MLTDGIFISLDLGDQWAVLLNVLLIKWRNGLLDVALPALHHNCGEVLLDV